MSESLQFNQRRLNPLTKVVLLVLLASILLVTDKRVAAVKQMRAQLAGLFYPVQWLANQPVSWYQNANQYFTAQNHLQEQNKMLGNENSRLKIELSQLKGVHNNVDEQAANSRLKDLLSLPTSDAQIVYVGNEPFPTHYLLNKGSSDGIKTGQAVVTADGLLGQITSVGSKHSELTLLNNAQTVIPVMVARTGVRSLLYGNLETLDLRYFPVSADLQKGDVLVTSGMDNVYPAGIPVASITSITPTSGTPFYKATTRATANLTSTRSVLILAAKPVVYQADTSSLTPASAPESASAP
ncbi:rod shape-determining protein MreC [Vitreoscilla massiliensis]|uniref:Cell shape-determining protein MreC n=1 Tax=Vitreoscilla massiliensis TaxID=1689272 RepID=A0ABY4E079_9NEIS|nr:rod shape-determining protein MreC [Vitreoscilla massiliensis]UOO88669.1 rod shape-determining protein MreC [Vitreoscilla massiliensis]